MHAHDVVTDWSYALAGFLVSTLFGVYTPVILAILHITNVFLSGYYLQLYLQLFTHSYSHWFIYVEYFILVIFRAVFFFAGVPTCFPSKSRIGS